jgi:hypothetical protein
MDNGTVQTEKNISNLEQWTFPLEGLRMRRYAFFVGALLLVTSMSTIVTADVGYGTPLAVYITVPEQEWAVGTDLDVTVHVFNDGEHYDPDEVNLTVGDLARELNLTTESTGVYTVTFTIEEDDVDYDGDLFMQAYAIDGGGVWPDMAWDYVYLWGEGAQGDFSVYVDTSDYTAYPGQTVEASISTTFDGEPVDADVMDVYVYDTEYDPVTYDLNRVGTGDYELTFGIPGDLDESGYFEVEVEAEYEQGGETYYDGDWISIDVYLLQVWVHYIDVTEARAEMEIFVMDPDGTPIEGADVDLTYYYYNDDWDDVEDTLRETTDENGMTSFVLTYGDLAEDEYYVEMEIEIDTGDARDDYYETLYVRDYVPDVEWGLVAEPDQDFLDPDSDVDLTFSVRYDGEDLPLHDVSYYFVTDTEVIDFGSGRTDVDGNIEVSFHTPAVDMGDWGWMDVAFTTQILGSWEAYEDYLIVGEGGGEEVDLRDMVDPGSTLTVAPFKAGETAEVTLQCSAADGLGEEAFGIWFAGSLDNFIEADTTEWGILGSWGAEYMLGEYEFTWSDGAYHASVPIPIVMDPDTPLTFLGAVGIPDMMSGNLKVAYKEGVHALPPNDPPAAMISFPEAGQQYSGDLLMEGTASDDKGVEKVEFRIDGGVWNEVDGTEEWNLTLDTTLLDAGTHQLEVRAWDGEEWSEVASVVFEVDQPPEVSLDTPITGSLDGIITFIGKALDDNDVDKVEYQVDDEGWYRADGTDDWSFELDTTMFTSDDHVLWLRASDGERFSLEISFDFTINQIPLVAITGHVDGKVYKDKVTFEGTASDDKAVVSVEIRIDAGDWVDVGALAAWEYKAPTKGMKEGNHSVEVRVYDGEKYSDTEVSYFTYKKSSEEPGFGLLAALMAVLIAVPVARSRRREG